MNKDFGKKLDVLTGSQMYLSKVVFPALAGLAGLTMLMDSYGFAQFELANKMFLVSGMAVAMLMLAVGSYRAAHRRLEIYQRGVKFYTDEREVCIPYHSIDRFEWEDDYAQLFTFRICTKHCHIVDKQNDIVASVNSREYAKMLFKMSKLESKLKGR